MLKPASAWWDSLGCRRGRIAWFAALVAALVIGSGYRANGAPPQAQTVQTLRGCCLCRAPVSGQLHTSISCTDDLAVSACDLKCRGEGATSFVYGNAQSCSAGCAGLATGSLR